MSESTMGWVARDYDYLACSGADAVDLLGRISTGDLRPLHQDMTCGWTAFTSNQGKMLDWCLAIHSGDGLFLRCSKGRASTIKEWIEKYIIMEDASVSIVTDDWASFTVMGIHDASALGLEAMPGPGAVAAGHGAWHIAGLPGLPDCVDVVVRSGAASQWQDRLKQSGASTLGADVLEKARVLGGIPSPDFEFAKEINPLELRLADTSICFDKGCYIGQEVIARMDSYDKTARLLMGFECAQELVLDDSMRIRANGKSYGKITSIFNEGGTSIGLAIVQRDAFELDDVELTWEGGSAAVTLVQRAFWSA